MRYFTILGIVLFTLTRSVAQQQPHYSQYMFSGLVINPAYAGLDEVLSATFMDRHQWQGIEGAPTTQTLAMHAITKRKKVGLGLLISHDQIGVHKNTTAQLSYAYHLKLSSSNTLSFGLQAGIVQLKADYASLFVNPSQPPDPKLTNFFLNELYASVGSGIYFKSKKWQIGFSIPELLPRTNAINDSTLLSFKTINTFTLIRYKATLTPDWTLEPAVLLKRFGDTPLSFESTLASTYKEVLTVGATFRLNESVGIILRAKLMPQLNVGYAYDYPLLLNSRSGLASHEIMLNYQFRFTQAGIKSPRL